MTKYMYRTTFIVVVFCAVPVHEIVADTFVLRSGVQVHGVLEREQEGRFLIRTGGRLVRIPKNEVVKIENNDKDGSFDHDKAKQAAEERERELTEETGLSKKQRDRVYALIGQLDQDDPLERRKAKESLVEMAAEPRVFVFIENILPERLPAYLPSLLEVLVAADPVRAQTAIRAHAIHLDVNTRAAALELLGIMGDTKSLKLMMRGLIDREPVVRMAASSAVCAVNAKEATPLLIANLSHADLRVEIYAEEALSLLWSEGDNKVTFPDADAWQAFWFEHRHSVPQTVDIEALEPLTPADARFDYC